MIGWWRAHGVRIRLTLWHVAAMIAVLGVYAAAIYSFVSTSLSESVEQQLRRDFQWAAATLDVGPDGEVTWTEPQLIYGEEELPWVQVWRPGGRDLLFRSAEAMRRDAPMSSPLAQSANDRGFIEVVSVPGENAAMRILTRRFKIREQTVIVQVGRSEASMRQELGDLRLILVFGLPLAVATAGLGGYTLARRALRPVEEMTERAQHISAERLSDRLPVANPDDEMGRLALVFNETLGRLQESFEQMRRFTADVSHELRTPLTAMRSVGEVGLRGNRDEAAYRGIIGSMLEETDRLASLVDRLLTLSRAETGQAKLSVEAVNLTTLAENVLGHLGVLAEEKGQHVSIEGELDVHALADRTILRQALINLVDNAIKYTPAGGRITIEISGAPRQVTIDVVDSGPGVPVESRAHIFDRFYRVAETGVRGTGLGLSLARGAVEASGGRLTLIRTGPEGSRFRIVMPAAQASAEPRKRRIS